MTPITFGTLIAAAVGWVFAFCMIVVVTDKFDWSYLAGGIWMACCMLVAPFVAQISNQHLDWMERNRK